MPQPPASSSAQTTASRPSELAGNAPPGNLPAQAGRFVLCEELGRGGMGIVVRADDPELGRSLAVKVLQSELLDNAFARRRFLDEARLTAQLQHPGIPPIHEMGSLPDGRPFFAMKLIHGRTLADLLEARASLSEELPRLLGVFEQVAQAVGYAHSRGIIHRDLKPANIMVGSFGEVQVMDWGLARLTAAVPAALIERSEGLLAQTTTAAQTPDDGRTRDGTVIGTPAFMAPEQARGLIDCLDARTDVFGLGSILCAILTGQPPFVGGKEKARHQSVAADLSETHARLGSCRADPELIALARRCLEAKQSDRPADGGEVARAVAGYLAGVQRRLQESERDRARAEVRVVEERKRRRLTALVAALLLTLLLAGGGGAWAWQRQQQREAEQAARTRQRIDELAAVVPGLLHAGRWGEARTSLEQIEQLLARAGEDEERAGQHGRLKAALKLGQELDSLRRERLVLIEGGTLDRAMPRLYRSALASHRFDIDREEPEALGERVAVSPVKEALLATLDDAAFLEKDGRRRERLLRAARHADKGAWQDRLRDPRVRGSREELQKLAEQADLEKLPAARLSALADLLERAGGDPLPLLRRAQTRQPEDFWLCFGLGVAVSKLDPGQQGEAAAMFAAARALRPDSVQVWNNLGHALTRWGKPQRGEQILRQAVDAHPTFAAAWGNLAYALFVQSKLDEALKSAQHAVVLLEKANQPSEQGPDICDTLGLILQLKGDHHAAVAAFRKGVIPGDPRPLLLSHLAGGLGSCGKREECRAVARRAVEVATRKIQSNPRLIEAWTARGRMLGFLGRNAEALDDFREVVRLAPLEHATWQGIGYIYANLGRVDEARSAFLRAIELIQEQMGERSAMLWESSRQMSHLEQRQGRMVQAEKYARLATQVDPNNTTSWARLAGVLVEAGKPNEARAPAEKTIRLARKILDRYPNDTNRLADLAYGHQGLGEHRQAVKYFHRILEIDPRNVGIRHDLAESLRHINTRVSLNEARRVLLVALRMEPKSHLGHFHASIVARRLGKYSEAIAHARESLRLVPETNTRIVLANALSARGDLLEALALQRQIVAETPDNGLARSNLAVTYARLGRSVEAAREDCRAVQLAPQKGIYQANLGVGLARLGDLPGSILAFEQAERLDSTNKAARERAHKMRLAALANDRRLHLILAGEKIPTDQRAARMLELYQRMESVRLGKSKPRDANEALLLADVANFFARRGALATGLYREAFQREPTLADDLAKAHRFRACLAALSAGLGMDVDSPENPDDPQREKLRQQAYSWWREELTARKKALAASGGEAALARTVLETLRSASVTHRLLQAATLQHLTPQERLAWRQLLDRINRTVVPRMPLARD